ncbi:MAG: class I mannose-6-phosphate isomerase [Prevotella sp.]|nr:class I mannose-6-phosphate isomerase [Prevotella sp.]
MNYYKFTPLLKNLIWGTESWQISGVPGDETVTDGKSLNELVKEQKEQLVGKANYQRFGNEFPLLIKFIDAHQDLSIQVHPTDEIAHRQGKPRGKTEMWYVMDSEPTATLYNGLKMQITPEQYKAMVADDTICDALARYQVKAGDCFFIPAGRIHAIGAGCYLAEIQQTSDITYRIYDYGRRDKDGNLRQLHTREAAESIDYNVLPDYRQHYVPTKNEGQLLVECPYFNTAVYDLTEPMTIDYSELDSFVILIGLKGEGTLSVDGEEVTLRGGESLLLPATVSEVSVEGTLKFLETYVLS